MQVGMTTLVSGATAVTLEVFDPVKSLDAIERHGVTLIGRLFAEGTIARAGMALERAANVAGERPPGF